MVPRCYVGALKEVPESHDLVELEAKIARLKVDETHRRELASIGCYFREQCLLDVIRKSEEEAIRVRMEQKRDLVDPPIAAQHIHDILPTADQVEFGIGAQVRLLIGQANGSTDCP